MASFRKRIIEGETRWDVTVTRQGTPRQSKTFSTKGAAELRAREVERGAWRSTELAERMTVAALLIRYRSEILPAKRAASSLQCVADKVIRGDLGRLPLLALTPERVATYRDERLRTRARNGGPYGRPQKRLLSTQTVRHEIALLKRAIDQGIREWVPLPACRKPGVANPSAGDGAPP